MQERQVRMTTDDRTPVDVRTEVYGQILYIELSRDAWKDRRRNLASSIFTDADEVEAMAALLRDAARVMRANSDCPTCRGKGYAMMDEETGDCPTCDTEGIVRRTMGRPYRVQTTRRVEGRRNYA